MKGLLLIALGFGLLLISGRFHAPLIDQRAEKHLQQVPPESTTPLVTLTTVAFGGFRGLVADALWLRAAKMQERGQFFEMVQLAEWITQLEPRVPEVWAYQAWNLAYNISVLFPEASDRWRWVNHGIDLLKQEGLKHNPTAAGLYWDIGWMYQHKIGMQFDLTHSYYKDQLANEIESVLPKGQLPPGPLPPQAEDLLFSTYAMNEESMRALEESYGPLDWRIPETHSLYWSTEGLNFPASSFLTRNLRRMQMQSLGALMRNGEYRRDKDSGITITLPRLDLIPIVQQEYLSMLEGQPNNTYLQQGFSNFLLDAVILLAEYGRMSEALDLYERLARMDENLTPGRENFQAFIQYYLVQDPSTLNRPQAMAKIVALLQNSLDPTLTDVRARGWVHMAKQAHRMYQESRQNEEHMERTGLPPFEEMQRLVR